MRRHHGARGHFLVVVAAVFLFTTPAWAAGGRSPGACSLELGTTLGDGFTNGMIALRHHTSQTSALRFGLDFFSETSDLDGDRTQTGFPTLDNAVLSENHGGALALQWVHFAPISNHVTTEFAIGPVVQYDRFVNRQGLGMGTVSFQEFEQRQTETSYGLELSLGFEWFFVPRMSLGGSAGLRALLGTRENVFIQRTGTGGGYSIVESRLDGDTSDIDTQSARILLVGYF